jgi:exopolysaccharide production protein ExoY
MQRSIPVSPFAFLACPRRCWETAGVTEETASATEIVDYMTINVSDNVQRNVLALWPLEQRPWLDADLHQSAAAGANFGGFAPAGQHEGGTPQPPLGGWQKRAIDVTIALSALVLAAPVMFVVALLIRATTGGPAMFSHSRVGFKGKPFNCYKFRSMVADADQVLRDHLANDPEAAREWAENRKLKRDPRVTLLGQMLRKSSLDELPQLFNILRGDMSCVGPRPIVTDELERYGDHVGEYLRTRPGLTGLWQVTGRSSTDYANRVALDSQYVREWSTWIDLLILVRTVFAVMRFDRAS